MARALLIAGDEPSRFLANLLPLRFYLESERGLHDIVVLKPGEAPQEVFTGKLATQLLRDLDEPLLLVYSGHGLPEGWVPSPHWLFPYPWLTGILAQRTGPTLFINGCCYPAAVFAMFERAGISPELVSVIAAGPANKVTYDGMIDRVILSWKRGAPYESKVGYFPKPVEIRQDDHWLVGKQLRLHAFLKRLFRAVEPQDVLAECRWGTVLDHHFIAQAKHP